MEDTIDCYYHDIESQPNEPTKYWLKEYQQFFCLKMENLKEQK